MVMRTGSRTMFSISNDGVLQLGEYQGSTPTKPLRVDYCIVEVSFL